MIDFAAALNEALNTAIDKKLEPLFRRLSVFENTVPTMTRLLDGEVILTADIQSLVDSRVAHGIESHKEDYNHNDFVTESDLKTKVDDQLDDVFQSKFEAALDGTRVTLNT